MAKCKMSNTVELRLLHICAVLMLVMSGVNAKCVRRMTREPSRRMELYFHDIIYNGHNKANATSAMVAAPDGGNLTTLGGESHFGDMAVFDDPITLGPQLNSTRVGRAQGLYFYDQKKRFSAWLGFTAVLDSREYNGTLTFAGADPIYVKKRDIVVVGGTGDFFLARGIANVQTHAFEGDVYFRLFLNFINPDQNPDVNAKSVEGGRQMTREPSRRMELYCHDIIYNGHNKANATSAMVATPHGWNLTTLGGESHFGDMAMFDNPIMLGPHLNSTYVGRAQGFYFYDQKKCFSSSLGFTFVLDSPKYRGTISFAGADPLLNPKRDISVIGGTGDFALARGIATVSTSAFEGDVYFRLLLNISLYD